jgi:excinuclease ABC subunit C
VPGLGPTRRKRLLKEFGSVKKMREQEVDMFMALSWLPDAVARDLYDHLHGGPTSLAPRHGSGLPSLESS